MQEEGIIVKAADSTWCMNDRSNRWLKVKPDYLTVTSSGPIPNDVWCCFFALQCPQLSSTSRQELSMLLS